MGLNEEQLKAAQECMSAEELVQKASEAGVELSMEQAQKIIDSAEMVEINEGDLDMVTGGKDSSSAEDKLSMFECSKCNEFVDFYFLGTDGYLYTIQCTVCGEKYLYDRVSNKLYPFNK